MKNILNNACNNNKKTINTYNILTNNEQSLLKKINRTTNTYPKNENIITLFTKQVIKNPNKIAATFDDEFITYARLNSESNKVACYLNSLNIGSNDIVCLCMNKCIEMLIGIMGIMKSGAAYCPILPTYPNERKEYIKSDTQTKLVLDYDLIYSIINKYDDGTSIRSNTINGGNTAYIMYTSGTTGVPKGVMVTHNNLISHIYAQNAIHGADKINTIFDKTLFDANISFDASIYQMFIPLATGNTVVIYDILSNKKINTKITFLLMTSSVLEHVIRETIVDLSLLEAVGTGGEKLNKNVIRLIRGVNPNIKIYNWYGPTEATVFVSSKLIVNDEVITIGSPVNNTTIFVLDRFLRVMPINTIGEIYVGGLQIVKGYLNDSDKSAKNFIAHQKYGRLYKTGDLGKYNFSGEIEYIGRNDFQVKINGQRIELSEIDVNMLKFEGIEQSITIYRNNKLISYITPEQKTEPIKEFLRNILPKHMIPSSIISLQKFDLNNNGKIDRNMLPYPILNISKTNGDYIENEKYILLNNLINDILFITETIKIDPLENLSLMGVDSLKRLQLLSRINKENYFICIDRYKDCETIYDLMRSIHPILDINSNHINCSGSGNNNDVEQLYNYYRHGTNRSIEHNPMSVDSDGYNVEKYLTENYLINSPINDKNIINGNKVSNITYNIGYSGACQTTTIMDMLIKFYKNKFLNINNINKFCGAGQNNLFNELKTVGNNDLEKIRIDSDNFINNYTFPGIDIYAQYDIIIIGLDGIIGYNKIRHIETNVELLTRVYGYNDSSIASKEILNKNKFVQTGYMTDDDVRNCIDRFLAIYPKKQIIFVTCQWNDLFEKKYGSDSKHKIRKIFNNVLTKYDGIDNVRILDINKFAQFNEEYQNTFSIPILHITHVANDLNNKINDIICGKIGGNINISQFFLESGIYDYGNCELSYVNEGSKYLTNVIAFNSDILNKSIDSVGLTLTFNKKFLRKFQNDIPISKLNSTSFAKLIKGIPVKTYKLIFNARTDKKYDNLRFRVYTGIKWILIDKLVDTNYQQFELEAVFDFTKSSAFRIGFFKVEPNTIVFINNPYLDF